MRKQYLWIVLPILATFALSIPLQKNQKEFNNGKKPDVLADLKENKFLQEELALAKNSILYLVIDIPKKNITLRIKGLVLKEWPIKTVRFWGSPPPFAALTVIRKTSMSVPQRIKIKPGEVGESGKIDATGNFQLEALEIADMPPSYALVFERNTLIYIRPEPKNFGSRIYEIGFFLKWYVGLPIKNLWFSLKRSPQTLIDIRLANEKDSKGLYWAMTDKIKGFIVR